jgi:hypothetical protein
MRGEPDVIGPKYALRLADLREWHCIEVKCSACGRIGLYPDRLKRQQVARLRRAHRWTYPTDVYLRELVDNLLIMDLEPMLRCDQCGNREHNSMQIVKLLRNA